jgi:hypothetical protein
MYDSNELSHLAKLADIAFNDWFHHPESEQFKIGYEFAAKRFEISLKTYKDEHDFNSTKSLVRTSHRGM